MSVDRGLVEGKIEEIDRILQDLKNIVYKSFGELGEEERLSLRRLITSLVEASSTICSHLLLREFGEKVEGGTECLAALKERGVMPGELVDKMARALKVREQILGEGGRVDDRQVYVSVKEALKDFERFTMYIRRLLKETE